MSNIITSNRVVPITAINQSNIIFEVIQKDFGFPLKERLHIAPEVAMYRIGEDESIWQQAKDQKYDFQVFFDGEFICWVMAADTEDMARLKFLKGFRDKYKEGKIHMNPQIYEIEALKKAKEEKEKAEKNKKKKEVIRKKVYQKLKKQ